MFRTLIRGLMAASVVALAACGGGSSTSCQDGAGGTACGGGNNPDPAEVVSRLSLTLDATTMNNTGAETIAVTVVATNASNQTVAAAPVLISVDSNAEVAVGGDATDDNGEIRATVRLGEDRSNRVITVRAEAEDGSVVAEKTFRVVGAELTGVAVPADIEAGAAGVITFRLVDANDNPMTDMEIVVTGPGGVETAAVTGPNGEYEYDYTAPSALGLFTVRAAAGGTEREVEVNVIAAGGSDSRQLEPAGAIVRSKSISANPSVVSVNLEGTSNSVQIRALFVTDDNAPIKNLRVRFDLDGDPNSIGGTLNTGNSIVYTDANGVATATYTPGSRQSPTDGVTIRGCWNYSDFAAGSCPNASQAVRTTLTVIADPVSISIGTNNLIETGASGLTYVKRYVVQVVDTSGVAKAGVQISPSIDLLRYGKGTWAVVGDNWVQFTTNSCDNEDLNRNNLYEVYADGWDEDANGSFNLTPGRPALEPRKADVALSIEGSGQTDTSGIVVLRIEYPQNLGSWVDFNILVAASGVSGTEGRANFEGTLPVPADVVSDIDAEPPFRLSPYGIEVSPLVGKDFGGRLHSLCTNPR